MAELQPGDPAPDFDLPADGGGRVRLADHAGRMLALYFYPKDDTPGCTTEAKDFTAALAGFQDAGADIVGVSRDTPAKHDRFKAKHDLAVTLAADEDGAVCEAYGAWREKTLYGRKYMGIGRDTFLIGPDGRILRIWRNVRVAGHVDQVLAAAREAA